PTVSRFDAHRLELAIIAPRTRTGGDHLALHRLFFRRVGDDDATRRLLLALDAPNQHAGVQRTELHECLLDPTPKMRNQHSRDESAADIIWSCRIVKQLSGTLRSAR